MDDLFFLKYPFVGAVISIFMSLLISGLTGGFCSSHKVKRKYLHPVLHRWFGADDDDDYRISKISASYKNADRVVGIHDHIINSPTQKSRPYNYKYEAVSNNTHSINGNV